MRRFWTSVLAAGFVATVGLSAQGQPGQQAPGPRGGGAGAQQPQTQTQTQSQTASAKKVTVSGCIQSAPAGAASQGGSKFVLAMKPAGGREGGGAVGTAGTATRYSLEGEEKAISPHLNHQVEITGTLEGSTASAQSSTSSAGAKAQASAAPTLKVESVKMVSATCS